jgi:ABC-2 type transport system ATP-binding protein
MSPPPALSFQHISKHYPARSAGGEAVQALQGINFSIQPGEFFGLLGPNGAGKTTLIQLLAGLARPTQGRIAVMGHDVQTHYAQARRCLGIVPQELVFDPFFTVRETLLIQSGYFGLRNNHQWVDELLHQLGLSSKAHANMRQLSGGMKRRVLVAQALVHKPQVIVLDEPTAGVDVELRQSLWHFIAQLNRQGHTVLLTTHYLEEAEALCSRIAMLKAGHLLTLQPTTTLLAGHAATIMQFKTSATLPPDLLQRARITGRSVHLKLAHAQELEAVLVRLRQSACPVEDLEVHRADLEDVFLDIMQNTPQELPA